MLFDMLRSHITDLVFTLHHLAGRRMPLVWVIALFFNIYSRSCFHLVRCRRSGL